MCVPSGPADLHPMILPKNSSCPKEVSAFWVEVDTLCSILDTEEGEGQARRKEGHCGWADLRRNRLTVGYDGWPVCPGWGQAGCALKKKKGGMESKARRRHVKSLTAAG